MVGGSEDLVEAARMGREQQPQSEEDELRRGFEMFSRSPAPIFTSAVERTLERSTTNRASGTQWWATISKAPGVKKEELQWLGLEDFLRARDQVAPGQNAKPEPVTREEVLEFVRNNGIRVEESVLGGDGMSAEIQEKLLPLLEERDRLMREWSDIQTAAPIDPEHGRNRIFTEEQKARLSANGARQREIAPLILELENQASSNKQGTRWSQYQLPGGSSYREMLLRLPVGEPTPLPEGAKVSRRDGLWHVTHNGIELGVGQTRREAIEFSESVPARQAAFRSSHFDQPNILAHVRFNERTDAQGRRTLFIEELQSDWGQGLRKDKERLHQQIEDNFQVIVERMKYDGVLKEVCD